MLPAKNLADFCRSFFWLPAISVQRAMALSTMAEFKAERAAYLEGFAENVRRLRKERGLSQTDLYSLADLHRTQVGRVEGAKVEPRLMTLAIIAHALGVTLDELIDGLPIPKERKPPPKSKRKQAKRPSSK
jgi:ribosome-binding protein aMBF1 (putative translation factor)